MSTNYDSTNIGVPYVRVCRITILYPDNQVPTVVADQEVAVKLADGTITAIGSIAPLTFSIDLVSNGNTPIPLVDPTSGAALGPSTTANQLMLGVLAALRVHQIALNP